jgi:hypothetical protein
VYSVFQENVPSINTVKRSHNNHFSQTTNNETKMTNVSVLIKILVSSLVVAALVATYLSAGSKNGSTVGLKGSRQLQGGTGIADLIAFLQNQAANPRPPRGPTPAPTPGPPIFVQQSNSVNNLLDRFNTSSSALLGFKGFDDPTVIGVLNTVNASSTALLGFKGFDDPAVTNALNAVNASSNAIFLAAGTQFSQFPSFP